MKTYIVNVTPKNPSWNDKEGIDYEITAPTKREAMQQGRKRATQIEGIWDRHDGALIVTAKEAE